MVRSRIVAAADHNTAHKSDAQVADTASKLLGEADPDVLFVHFDDVDHAGHAHGVHPEQMKYIQAIESVDAHVGRLLKTLHERKTRPLEDWLIVGSTDHGGSGKSHGRDIPEHRTIFLIVSGNSAARGTIDPPPTIVDVAPTVIKHLSIPIDPAWKLDGKPVGLK
jgi:predicted AlkP superfamily pyrophosphatase or phosphodiesterase